MKFKRLVSVVIGLSVCISMLPGFSVTADAANIPEYQSNTRRMERISHGLIAAANESGVYLSWRLLGTESLSNQAFDIYKNGKKLVTTGVHDATCYTDASGKASDVYQVVRAGESIKNADTAFVLPNYASARADYVRNGTSETNTFSYIDVPISMPEAVTRVDGKTSTYYKGESGNGANDASIGDLDGDGEYEIVLKWDPQDSKDSAGYAYTGNVYIDAYEIDENNGGYKWRIDLGHNITAGAHYTQFMVYDFDGNGKSEVAMVTAPGTIDGTGKYVTEVGDTQEIRTADNTAINVGSSGRSTGKNLGPEYYTIFDGETGAALYTTDAIPLGSSGDWGDSSYNRAFRYLAAVAYIDGVNPSIIMCRGYYNRAIVRAYTWDGEKMTLRWEHRGISKGSDSLYGQGNHNLSVADVDNDGKDEIVYGSAVLDDNGKAIGNTYLGHGDAMHVSDFNNDGYQEVFSVKEDKEGYKNNAASFRTAYNGSIIWGKGASGDTGRGVMANIDDAYAKTHPDALALGWSSSHDNTFDLKGNEIAARPGTSSRGMTNFLVYWDGDLSREILDDNQLGKYYADTGTTVRFYEGKNGYISGNSNNDSKHTPCLVADLWGDWREEIIMSVNNFADSTEPPALRIFTSTLPTSYRLTTLMHDCQYRLAIAWQNVGYNQPPHQSYYIGSAALATDNNGNELNYLAPATKFTSVVYPELVEETTVTLDSLDGGMADLSVIADSDIESARLTGVLYNSDNTIKQIKTKTLTNLYYAEEVNETLSFDYTVDDYDLKIYLWDTFDDMTPLAKTVTRKAGALSKVKVQRVFNRTVIDEMTEEIKPGTAYSVSDSQKADIEYLGVRLEYDPDATAETKDVTVKEGETVIKLMYKAKNVPLENEEEIANIYINKDGIGEGVNWILPDNAEYKVSGGIKYVEFTDDGTNPLAVTFNNTSDKLVVEFDLMMNEMTTGGDVFGAVPYSGNIAGKGVGWRRNGDGTRYEPAVTSKEKYLTITADAYKNASTYQNKWTHIVLVLNNGNVKTTYSSQDGTVYVDNKWNTDIGAGTVGTASNPVNKIIFGRGYGSGSGTMGVRNLKAYTVNLPDTMSSTVQVDVPGTYSFTADTAHSSMINGFKYNADGIYGEVSYEIRDTSNNIVMPDGLTIDSQGLLTATEEFDISIPYTVVVKLGGEPWRTYDLTYRAKELKTSTQGFDSGLNGFKITSKDGYAIAHENGTVKYTKTSGTENDSTVYLEYPITTANLGDNFELAFDIMANSGAFKGYMYFLNSSGEELVRMETHMYEPRFKVPSGTTTENFKPSFGSWYTVVLGYNNGKGTMKIYNQSDTNRESALMDTEFDIAAQPTGLTFKWQVAQNIQNGSVDNTDEYYFDNFTYSYYDYN